MHRTLSLKIGQVNSYLVCPLCKGYLIDSYTINECLHSFCKSCIIKYIKRKECCPVCKINIIKDRMNLFLKPDVNLQCIVYKIVPELFKKEMKRRRQFYLTHPKALKFLKKKKIFDKEAVGELDDDIFVIDKYTDISLSIEYSDTGLADVCESARYKELDPPSSKIYLQCPATLSIQLLKKFISIKFDLSTTKNLDVMYDDKPLSKDITLLDVSYIYAWRRTAPMRLFYRINDQKMTNDLDKISQSGLNVLTPIDNNSERKVDEIFALSNLPKNAPIKNENDNGVENFPPKVQLNENQMT
ncbi:polycomb complex BMI-1, partial [Brachionus plicatilis]